MKILDRLETKWRTLIQGYVPSTCVGGTQFYTWDCDNDPKAHGMVICIGSNYSQYPTQPHHPTKENLDQWMIFYQHAANLINNNEVWSEEFRIHNWWVGNKPPPKPKIFIMTNIVPWITSRKWSLLSETNTLDIINSYNARFQKAHLLDLQMLFPNAFIVGHGINKNILPHLYSAVSLWNNYMLWANLTFQQTPSKWDKDKEIFIFGGKI